MKEGKQKLKLGFWIDDSDELCRVYNRLCLERPQGGFCGSPRKISAGRTRTNEIGVYKGCMATVDVLEPLPHDRGFLDEGLIGDEGIQRGILVFRLVQDGQMRASEERCE
jgi:hypothetical protein